MRATLPTPAPPTIQRREAPCERRGASSEQNPLSSGSVNSGHVCPEQLKFGEKNVRGYERSALSELWDRYLGPYASSKSTTTATLQENEPKPGGATKIGEGPDKPLSDEGSGVAEVAPIRKLRTNGPPTGVSVLCGVCHRLGLGYRDDGRYVCVECAERAS